MAMVVDRTWQVKQDGLLSIYVKVQGCNLYQMGLQEKNTNWQLAKLFPLKHAHHLLIPRSTNMAGWKSKREFPLEENTSQTVKSVEFSTLT